MLSELLALFERASFVRRPSPRATFDKPASLRGLAKARHVGKLVLTLPHPMAPDGTVLITGAPARSAPCSRAISSTTTASNIFS